MKKGRLTLIEIDYIKQNYNRLTYEQIATQLNRDVNSIRQFIEKKLGKNVTSEEDFENKAEFDIRRRPFWKDLSKQFAEDELDIFIYHWKRIIAQFKDDVFPTEEIQIINMLKLEVMMNRMLKQQNEVGESIKNIEHILQLEKDVDVNDRNVAFIATLEQQLATLRMAQDNYSKEFRELLNKQGSILKDMKSTREQRIKKIEDSRQSFLSWMSSIISNVELRRELGLRMEKMRLAMLKEKDRLSEYHTYVDGSIDRPLLNFETDKED